MDTLQQIIRFNIQKKKLTDNLKPRGIFAWETTLFLKTGNLMPILVWNSACIQPLTHELTYIYELKKMSEIIVWQVTLDCRFSLILLVCYFKFKKKIFIQWFPHYKTYPEQWPNVNLKACSSILLCIFNSIFNLFSATFNENLHTNGINIFVWWVPSRIIF